MKKKKKAKTIGEMSNTRGMFGFNSGSRVHKTGRGKGSYRRQEAKKMIDA